MKMMQWLSKAIISAVITSMICIMSTFWVVNTYVDMILEQYNLKAAGTATPTDWSKFVTHASKQLAGFHLFGSEAGGALPNGATARAEDEAKPVFGEQSGTGTSSQDVTKGGNGNGSPNGQQPDSSTGSTSQRKPPEDAVAVFGHQSGSGSGATEGAGSGEGSGGSTAAPSGVDSDTGGKIVVSGEEFTKKKEQLSTNEKTQIFNLMVKRVPQNEMQRISKLMEDGITAGELKEIEQLLQAYLKPEEYSQLLSMIKPE